MVSAEVDILAAVGHHGLVERHGHHIVVHKADDAILSGLLVGEDVLAVEGIGEGNTAAQGRRQHIDRCRSLHRIGDGVNVVGVLLRRTLHVGIHLIARIAYAIHGIVALLVALHLDDHVLRFVLKVGIVALVGKGIVGRQHILLQIIINRGVGGGFVLGHVDDHQHNGGDGHQEGDDKGDEAGTAAAAATTIGAHAFSSASTLSAARSSPETHSTTAQPLRVR